MSPTQKNHLVIALTQVTLITCATPPSFANPTPVEVWRGGDDGLTARFADALEATFRGAHEFLLSSGKAPGTLIVTIPTNLTWQQVGGRTVVNYVVEFSSGTSQLLGRSQGKCPEERLQECAVHVLGDANTIKAKLGR